MRRSGVGVEVWGNWKYSSKVKVPQKSTVLNLVAGGRQSAQFKS